MNLTESAFENSSLVAEMQIGKNGRGFNFHSALKEVSVNKRGKLAIHKINC